MKKIFLLVLVILTSVFGVKANDLNNDLIELAKIYRNFMFRNSPNESTYEQLKEIKSSKLILTTKFIRETIRANNNLTKEEFLKLPDEQSMKFIYIIRRINWNIREENPKDNIELIAEISNKSIPRYELIDNYYDMLFSGVGNKNRPFDLSNVNFLMTKYELKDDTEKGIFFLKAMDLCGTSIWGYMNIVKPPNYKKAMEYIELFPKFNGQPYYQYLYFGFADFNMKIEKDKGEESYKSYYINKYYDTLLSHLACLSQKNKQEAARTDLILGSILKEENYYKYSKKKDILESLITTEDEAIDFTIADTPPITSDCNPNLSNVELKVCFVKSITNQVLSNFDSSLLQHQGLKSGTYRIYAVFTVNKKGKVKDVIAEFQNKVIAKEIVQAVKTIKKMTPAYLDGKPVSVNYTLPIKFKVN